MSDGAVLGPFPRHRVPYEDITFIAAGRGGDGRGITRTRKALRRMRGHRRRVQQARAALRQTGQLPEA
jgi:hypothetical protein